ncbi:hypothetical protein [Streptomyces sp. T12]|uniref:hypothetical protein n=1 Tax=Streptomyces sp. T12 TaxID=477697 RepID=UPI0037D9FDBE
MEHQAPHSAFFLARQLAELSLKAFHSSRPGRTHSLTGLLESRVAPGRQPGRQRPRAEPRRDLSITTSPPPSVTSPPASQSFPADRPRGFLRHV